MFTVKLVRGKEIKIVSAMDVEIYPCGPRDKPTPGVFPVPNDPSVKLVVVKNEDREDRSFYITELQGKEIPTAFAETMVFWETAYVETDKGKTTEVVHGW